MKILILGEGEHGKDTLAEMIRDLYGLTFQSSSHFVAERAVYPTLKETYGYKTLDECYADRHQHREEWYQLIKAYNTPDLTKLTRELLAVHDVYVGLRDDEELEATKNLYHMILWVDASQRKPKEHESSIKVKYNPRYMYWLDNNKDLAHLRRQVRILPIK